MLLQSATRSTTEPNFDSCSTTDGWVLKTKPKVVHNSANRDLLEKFWKDEYEHRDLVDFESSKNDFKRAIEVAGPLSLYSASREDLQKEIAKHAKGNKQRRVVSRLNTLLKYIQRNVKLRKDKKNQVTPSDKVFCKEKLDIKGPFMENGSPANLKLVVTSGG